MTNKKILTLISFLLLFSFLMVGCKPVNLPPEITSCPGLTATVGESFTYDVVATDPNAGDVLTYSLIDEPDGMLIDPDNGVITWTPATAGDFLITVKVSDEDGLFDTQSFKITVKEPVTEPELELTGIVVAPKTMTLFAGGSEAIKSVTATYEIKGYDIPIALEKCTFDSDDEKVATVSDAGLVTGVAEGTATITVCYGGKTDTIEVTVNPVLLTSIVVDPKTMNLVIGVSDTITSVTAYYNDGSKDPLIALGECTYASSATAVATVSSVGVVTAVVVSPDPIIITVSYTEGDITKADTLAVTVSAVELDHIVVLPEEMTLYFLGKEEWVPGTSVLPIESITAHYNNGDEVELGFTDCSYGLDPMDIVKVNVLHGKVKAVGVGKTTITLTYGGKTDTIEVTVKRILKGIVVDPQSMYLVVGESETITSVTAHYVDGSTAGIALGDCDYLSSNTNYVTVSSVGVVTAVAVTPVIPVTPVPIIITVSYTEEGITATGTIECLSGSTD